MPRRQPHSSKLPRLWLVTDERVTTEALMRAVARLPRGSGIILRHYATPTDERRQLYGALRAVGRRRGLMLIVAGDARQARRWLADGFHARARGGVTVGNRHLVHTASAHGPMELRAAERAGADMVFISPVFATRSHPDGRVLGRVRFAALARQATVPVIALGGMNSTRAASLRMKSVHGWAAIDALSC